VVDQYSKFAIVASFLGLWIDSFLSHQGQLWIGLTLIFTFGILHGASDLALIEKFAFEKSTGKHFKILLCYVTFVLAGAFFFYVIPWIALILFIMVSGYHFGEQHWIKKIDTAPDWLKFSFQWIYGMLILFLIFIFHTSEVQRIVFEITSHEIKLSYLVTGFKVIASTVLVLGILLGFKCQNFKNKIISELFYLLVFTVIFKTSSLIWGFALYFILWHSIPSIRDQVLFLCGKSNFSNLKMYFYRALPYWTASLFGIALLYLIFKDEMMFLSIFFSFLASITFPHVVVMQTMFKEKLHREYP
jgi:Brp/Blh family beta-carotene 15,15'-monooxygenase